MLRQPWSTFSKFIFHLQTTRFHFDDIFTFASFFSLFVLRFCIIWFPHKSNSMETSMCPFSLILFHWHTTRFFFRFITFAAQVSEVKRAISIFISTILKGIHTRFETFTYRHMLNWNRIKTLQDWNELYSHY